MKYRAVLALLLCLCSPGVSAGTEEDFQTFLRSFFTDPQFQRQRVRFPLEWQELVENKDPAGEPFVMRTTRKTAAGWQHLKGPAYFDCKTSCYDLVTYDNFKQQESPSKERVLAFKGVGNGIQLAFYFRQIDGRWMLVRYVDEGT
jgi:hypothetical protein